MRKALDPRDHVDRLYVSRKESGIELTWIDNNVNASIQRLEDYIEKRRGILIQVTKK